MKKSNTLGFAMIGALAAGLAVSPYAHAQQPRQPDTSAPAVVPAPGSTATGTTDAARTERRSGASMVVEASALEAGANSFTEGQVRERLEDAGFTNVQGLRKDDRGFWHGRATRGGSASDVAMDFRGRIAVGAGAAALGSNAASSGSGATSSGTAARPDGTPGNPPSTMTGRAVDRAQGETPRPDGTPGNPPGTAAGRALDRATTPNTSSGTTAARPDGTPGNPPSTMTGRAVDRAQGETPRPDGTPGNPAGTAAGRALDRATGSNTTGTNPPAATPTR